MEMPAAIQAVINRQDLAEDQMRAVMKCIMTGAATPAQIGGFLVGLRMKGETVDEIAAAASVMRELATKVSLDEPNLVDTCGTGGDGVSTFNVSTASAMVVAAAGGNVAKHGNRSISSKSGSADLLEMAGVKLDITPEQVAICVRDLGVGFMFAPLHHAAMKYAIGPRREMGVRTIFNLLGPLTNPASALCQVIGVYSEQWVEPIARVLQKLGSRHVLVVHGSDGMDEITISGPTFIAELKDGQIGSYEVSPSDFGYSPADIGRIRVADAKESLAMIHAVFENQEGPARDIVCMNAGAAIYAADIAPTLAEGVRQAEQAIANGKAKEIFEQLIHLTQRF